MSPRVRFVRKRTWLGGYEYTAWLASPASFGHLSLQRLAAMVDERAHVRPVDQNLLRDAPQPLLQRDRRPTTMPAPVHQTCWMLDFIQDAFAKRL